MILRFYTDGSGIPLDNTYKEFIGGYSVVMVRDGAIDATIAESKRDFTNNRSELFGVWAAINLAMTSLQDNKDAYDDVHAVYIHTDSTYVLGHIDKMGNKNFNLADDAPNFTTILGIKESLDKFKELYPSIPVKFVKAAAHATEFYNNIADELAKGASRKLVREIKYLENLK